MCGTSLLQAAVPVQVAPIAKPPVPAAGVSSKPAAAPTGSAAPSAAPAQRSEVAPSKEEPLISGPSFLGLNQPAPAPRRTNPLSIDPHAAPSSADLDYLLEDEEPKRSGAWKFILIVIALALAAGFGYLRWKNQSVPSLGLAANKRSAAAQSSEASEGSSSAGSSRAVPQAASSSQPATVSPPAPDAAGASTNSANPSATTPTSTTSAPANPATNGAQPSPVPDVGASGAGGASSAGQLPSAAGNATTTAPSTGPAATAAPKPSATQPLPKPHAAFAPAPDAIARAQRYIYGKGVRQNCDRGLRILKPAVDQGNPKAMIEMGALYSAGLCTPRDLPTSYRWFALALRKDPNNQSLQADLNKLWGEMTQPERQLAIKLSQ
jgi:TPR repeat protein